MSTHSPQFHLTADELDGILERGPGERETSHLATCEDCLRMITLDREVVAALGSLPHFDPATGFDARVMAQVAVGRATVALVPPGHSPREVAARRRVLAGGLLAGGALAAGFVWAVAHPSQAVAFAGPALSDAGHSLWLSLQTVAANISEQPWSGAMRDALGSPARALPFIAGAAGAYALLLAGLRRLLTEPAPNARW